VGGGIKLGRLFGIEITVQPSWFITIVVLTWSLATAVFPSTFVGSQAAYWVVGALASLLLFASVLVHELAHSLVARAQGIRVKGITLFLLGGVSSIEDDPSSPGREVLLAGVGPLSSLLLGGVLIVAGLALRAPASVHVLLIYLGVMNAILAVFNMLPGFPLDGGRVLRAVLWARWHDPLRATRGSAQVGRALGYVMAGGAVLLVATGDLFGGLWIGFVGWMLIQASRAAIQAAAVERRLSGVPVTRLMTKPVAWVPPYVTLESAAHDYLLANNARCLPVQGGAPGEFDGVVCLSDLQRRASAAWGRDRVLDVMSRREDTLAMAPDRPAMEALRLMATRHVDRIAVLADGRLLGLVDRAAAFEYVQRRDLVESHRAHLRLVPPLDSAGPKDPAEADRTKLAS
jgi:Zn-dependent protease